MGSFSALSSFSDELYYQDFETRACIISGNHIKHLHLLKQVLKNLQDEHYEIKYTLIPELEQHITHLQQASTDIPKNIYVFIVLFKKYLTNILAHFNYEENHIFLYAENLINSMKLGSKFYNTLDQAEIHFFMATHTQLDEEFNQLHQLIDKIFGQQAGFFGNSVFYSKWNKLKYLLDTHAFQEENIFIPLLLKVSNFK